jgi:regulator of replication initiation timing
MGEAQTDTEITAQMAAALEAENQEGLEDGEGEGEGGEEPTEIEQQAMDQGWNPEGVEGKRNISAEEFVERSSLFDRIHKLEKQTKSNDKVIDALKKYNETISEKAYDRAIQDLKQQKFQALEDGDNARVLELDDQIEKTRAEKPQEIKPETTEAYSTDEWNTGYEGFADKNVWYGRRADMTKAADRIGLQHKQSNPDVSPEELFTYVQGEIKSQYKNFFEEPSKPTKVGTGGRRTAATANKKTIKDVPEEDREVALTLIRTGTISEEDYIKSYFSV